MGVRQHKLIDSITEQMKEVIEEYSKKTDLLKELEYKTGEKNKFEHNTWVAWNEYSRCKTHISFEKFEELITANIIDEIELDVIKCFFISLIEEGYSVSSLRTKINSIAEIIRETGNFKQSIINNKYMGLSQEEIKRAVTSGVIEYFEFLEYNELLTKEQVMFCDKLEGVNKYELNIPESARILPPAEDVFKTGFYIEKFFMEEKDKKLKAYFYPVYIWWKITNVIPMRASEFAFKLNKDCLVQKNKNYYLKVNRIKQSKRKTKYDKKKIPLLEEIQITEDNAMMLKEYLMIAKEDKERNTFFSYKTLKRLGTELKKYGVRTYLLEERTEEFVLRDFSVLLDEFYTIIIREKYKDRSIGQQLKPGDTRHLAFCSLKLQGLSEVEIALMGGHRHIHSQGHYIGHTEYYRSLEMLKYLRNSKLLKEETENNIKNIIFNKSRTSPKHIKDSIRTEEGIGYCMAEVDGKDDICEHPRCCIFCSKWWCAPTAINFDRAVQYIENDYIGLLETMIIEGEKTLKKVMQTSRVVCVGDLIDIENSDVEEIRTQGRKIKSYADEIVRMKLKLLDLSYNVDKNKGEILWLDQK